jgi:hypothetical protein
MLQLSDNWLLITKPIVPFIKKLTGKNFDREHLKACKAIDHIIKHNDRFQKARWFTQSEFQNQAEGSSNP